jgi:3-deoxy-D-manno-octulosonate 8-phosphate phosphatase (KDO 8-P phosphatase)
MNHFIDNINHLLGKDTLSASDLSSKLNLSIGLEQTIKGTAHLSPDDLLKLSKYFGFSVDVLFTKDINPFEYVSAQNIKFLALDVDGVMTDGGMYYTESGDEFKRFDTRDGLAIKRLTKQGFQVGIISSGFLDALIKKRAGLLGIHKVQTGPAPKLQTLEQWCIEMDLDIKQVAFIGDDINDKEVIEKVGISACPADAYEEIKKIVSVVLSKNGGKGCVREFVDLYFTGNPYFDFNNLYYF